MKKKLVVEYEIKTFQNRITKNNEHYTGNIKSPITKNNRKNTSQKNKLKKL